MFESSDVVVSWWDPNPLVQSWVDSLTHAAIREREIGRLVRSEKFVSVYQTIPGNVPVGRLWTIDDLPFKWSASNKVRTVCVLLLPKGLGCETCGYCQYWTFVDESTLYRCGRCHPRPPKVKDADVRLRLEVKRLEDAIRRNRLLRQVRSSLSSNEAGELEKKELVGGPTK